MKGGLKMKNENYDDIKILFSDKTERTDELSKENITNKLKLVSQPNKSKIKAFPKITAVAAAIAIVTVGVFGINGLDKKVNTKPVSNKPAEQSIAYAPIDIGFKANKLSKFESKSDLENYFASLAKESTPSLYDRVTNFFYSANSKDALSMDTVEENMKEYAAPGEGLDVNSVATTVPSINAMTDDSVQNSAHAETNTQVKGVEEADIIKNDGRYLYIVSNESLLTIVDTQTMQAVYSQKIEANEKNKTITVDDIYLSNNTLVVTTQEYENQQNEDIIMKNGEYRSVCYAYMPNCNTVNIIYDVTDKSNPKEVRRFSQSGSLNNTRMVGTVLYSVTNYTVDISSDNKLKENCFPLIDGKKADVENIYILDKEQKSRSYIILSAFDTAKTDSSPNSVCVLGSSDEIYCSANNMYILDNSYSTEKNHEGEIVNIYSFDLDGDKVSFKASGVVPGYTEDQYFADEYNGIFRIATNSYDYDRDVDISSIYALDSELKVVGKLENIAEDEQIKSVRFMGDTAYVVTFKNTDPLFALDLANPSEMKILGEVKLPGFSEYLHSVGDGLLVGIGYNGDEENADWCSVKITLFDVSDKTNPKVLDSHIIKNASTDVNYEAKAFFFYPEENIIGIPLSYYNNVDGRNENYQFKLLKIENGKFTDKHNFAHPSGEDYTSFFRGSYIGDKLYTISSYTVAEFNIASGEMLRTLTYAEGEEQTDYINGEIIYKGDVVVATTIAGAE